MFDEGDRVKTKSHCEPYYGTIGRVEEDGYNGERRYIVEWEDFECPYVGMWFYDIDLVYVKDENEGYEPDCVCGAYHTSIPSAHLPYCEDRWWKSKKK